MLHVSWIRRGLVSVSRCLPILLASAFGTLEAADSLPLFKGLFKAGTQQQFLLGRVDGGPSAFLAVGETFDGYRIVAYDAKEDRLKLERDGQTFTVAPVEARVKDAPAEQVKATVAEAEALLTKVRFEELIERMLAQQRRAVTAQMNQVSSQLRAKGLDAASAEALDRQIGEMMSEALNPRQLKDDAARIYSEVFSKAELDQISSFYDSPVGKMLLERQPAVQERFGALMQAKMVDVVPRIQKLAAEAMAKARPRSPEATAPAVGVDTKR